MSEFASPLLVFRTASVLWCCGCVISASLGLFCTLVVAQMAKALALGIFSVAVPLVVVRKKKFARDLALVHLYACAFLFFQCVGMFMGKKHPQTWTLALWSTQLGCGLILILLTPFIMQLRETTYLGSGILRSNATWTTLHAITTQMLTQMACLSQISIVFSNSVFELGIKNTWAYQGVQYLLSFVSAIAAVLTVNSFQPKDILVFAMAVVTAAYFGLGVSFFASNLQNQNAITSVTLAFHSLLSCVYPILLLVSWIYTTRLFEPEFQPAGLSLAMASRWLVDACISAAFPIFLRAHKAVSFLALGAICFCSTAILISFPGRDEGNQIDLNQPSVASQSKTDVEEFHEPTEKKSPGSSTL